MPRWALWLPVGVLVALAAVLGWRAGWVEANVDESAVIAMYAERYLQDRAAAGTGPGLASECRARPAPAGQGWLVVICGPMPHDAARHYTYYVARDGGLVRVVGP